MTRSKDIAEWLRQGITAAGARGLAVGLSGGVDSAVVARLCQMASPEAVVGVMMPCHSDPRDLADAQLLAAHFAIPTVRVDLTPAYDRLVEDLQRVMALLPADQQPVPASEAPDIRARVPLANVKPRLRMTTLYFVANTLNYLVVGTGNRSELTIGYFTKYGDGGVDLLPLATLLKSEVRAMAKELGVPDSIIEKAPSAGLWLGQADEDEMGFTYAELENYLTNGPETVSPALAMRIERLVRGSDHKRSPIPTPSS
jgi:NAD+ synthase